MDWRWADFSDHPGSAGGSTLAAGSGQAPLLFDGGAAYPLGLSKRPGRYTAAFLLVAGFLCLLDYSRCQTWFYQYCVILALVSFWQKDADIETALDSCRIVVASAYLWGGIWKLNARFMNETFAWFIQPLLPGASGLTAQIVALPVPLLEIGTSLALLFPRTRVPAIAFCFFMHLLILVCIGPGGLNINQIVWPWNLFMIIFVILLFARTDAITAKALFRWRGLSAHTLILFLFLVAPILNIWSLWDSNFSFFLYSGNQAAGYIYMQPESVDRLPTDVRRLCSERLGQYILTLNAWAMKDMNVVVYPEPRVIKKIAKKIWEDAGKPPDMVLVMEERTFTRDKAPLEKVPCSAL